MRETIFLDDAGLPFHGLVLDDGTRVDRRFWEIAPQKATENPVPERYQEMD